MNLSWFPKNFLRPRGWGLLGAGVFVLLLAQVMGRRDLLVLGTFLVVLPLVAVAVLRGMRPDFTVYREFSPALVEAQSTTTVTLVVASGKPLGGRTTMTELLPPRFGDPPSFVFPSRNAPAQGPSRYQYHLRSAKRGQFRVGPVSAEFTDPFGLGLRQHRIAGADVLTVTPAAVELPTTNLGGARGTDGITPTRQRANPSDDDVMTREYRHGDPMRRVHWPATARHGQLMVRQEESVTTPEATLLLDSRASAYLHGSGTRLTGDGTHPELLSTGNFEWSVVAAMSVAAHLVERNFSLRALDLYGQPAFARSSSAPWPEEAHYAGSSGLAAVAESLAALELHGPLRADESTTGAAVGDPLLDVLSNSRQRGPLIAVVGKLSEAEATVLAAAAEQAAGAFVLLVVDRPATAGGLLERLRRGGWRALAVDSRTSLPAAWSYFGESPLLLSTSGSSALDTRRAPLSGPSQ